MSNHKIDNHIVHIVHKLHNGIYELQLFRPNKRNALTFHMYEQLAEHIMNAQQDDAVNVLIITGTDDCFTAGNDVFDLLQAEETAGKHTPILTFMHALKDFTKPVIASVNGVAVGIGTTLLLHCDLIYASEDATFQLPFVKLGLCPEYASTFLLPKFVGSVKANEWLLLGKPFTAKEALTAKLINATCKDPLEQARTVAKEMAELPQQALQKTKMLLKQPSIQNVNHAIDAELNVFSRLLAGDEFKQAILHFMGS